MAKTTNTLIMGASYGSLLGTKIAMGGHNATMVCLPAEVEAFNANGARVRMPLKGRDGLVEIDSRSLPGKLAAAGLLESGEAGEIKEACLLYHRITQVLRLCVTGAYDPAKSPAGLNQLVARAAGVPDIRAADSLVNDTQKRIAGLFDELIGPVG